MQRTHRPVGLALLGVTSSAPPLTLSGRGGLQIPKRKIIFWLSMSVSVLNGRIFGNHSRVWPKYQNRRRLRMVKPQTLRLTLDLMLTGVPEDARLASARLT